MTKQDETTPATGAPFQRPVMPVARRMRSTVGGEHWNVITEEDLAQQPEWVRELWSNGAECLYSQATLDVLRAALQEIATHSVCCDARHMAVAALGNNAELCGGCSGPHMLEQAADQLEIALAEGDALRAKLDELARRGGGAEPQDYAKAIALLRTPPHL